MTTLTDKLKPRGGNNSNICVAEGCYDLACLTLILPHPDDENDI